MAGRFTDGPLSVEEGRRRLAQLYARIPTVACVGKCADSCTAIDMSTFERLILGQAGFTVAPPRTVAEIAAEGRRTGRVTACRVLNALGACRAYEARPAICRAFGAVEGLECAERCEPAWRMTSPEFMDLLVEIERLSRRIVGEPTPGSAVDLPSPGFARRPLR